MRDVVRIDGNDVFVDAEGLAEVVFQAHEEVIRRGVQGRASVLEELSQAIGEVLGCKYLAGAETSVERGSDTLALFRPWDEVWFERAMDVAEAIAGDVTVAISLSIVRKWAGRNLEEAKLAWCKDVSVASISITKDGLRAHVFLRPRTRKPLGLRL